MALVCRISGLNNHKKRLRIIHKFTTPVARPARAPRVVMRCHSGSPILCQTHDIAEAAGFSMFFMSVTILGILAHDELLPLFRNMTHV